MRTNVALVNRIHGRIHKYFAANAGLTWNISFTFDSHRYIRIQCSCFFFFVEMFIFIIPCSSWDVCSTIIYICIRKSRFFCRRRRHLLFTSFSSQPYHNNKNKIIKQKITTFTSSSSSSSSSQMNNKWKWNDDYIDCKTTK